MKYLLLLIPVLLTGCLKTAPVKMDFPDVPEDLKVACPDLALVKDNAKMSDVISTVSNNYSQYHECKNKIDTWMEWHKQQKKIYDEVK